MGYNMTTLLNVSANTTGTAYVVPVWKKKNLVFITLTADATCAVEISQDGTDYREVASFADTDGLEHEVSLDNYGAKYIRAVASGVSGGTVKAVWTWGE